MDSTRSGKKPRVLAGRRKYVPLLAASAIFDVYRLWSSATALRRASWAIALGGSVGAGLICWTEPFRRRPSGPLSRLPWSKTGWADPFSGHDDNTANVSETSFRRNRGFVGLATAVVVLLAVGVSA